MTDAELLRAYLDRADQRAFAQLVERHIAVVYSAALRQLGGNTARAQDVTQNVFIEMARRARELAGHPVLIAWLHRATHWQTLQLLRAERRRGNWEQRAGEEWKTTEGLRGADVTRGPLPGEASIEWEQVRPWLDAAVDSLGERDREALLLRFFANWQFAEIGRSLGLSENAARMRVERALEKLRTSLARRGVKSSAAILGGAIAAKATVAPPTGLVASTIHASLAAAASGTATALTGAGGLLLMTKLQLAMMTGITLALAGGVVWQVEQNQMRDVRKTMPASAAAAPPIVATASPGASAATSPDVGADPARGTGLLPAQFERSRLDLLIRRGELDRTYAPLFRRLQLTPERLDRLKSLLVEWNQAEHDAEQIAKAQGLVFASAAEAAQATHAAVQDTEAELLKLLGADGLEYMRWFQQTRRIRSDFERFLGSQGRSSREDGAFMDALIRGFTDENPDHAELVFTANYAGFVERAQRFLTSLDDPVIAEQAQTLVRATQLSLDLDTMLREAALKGKLSSLSAKSQQYYGPPSAPAASADVRPNVKLKN